MSRSISSFGGMMNGLFGSRTKNNVEGILIDFQSPFSSQKKVIYLAF